MRKATTETKKLNLNTETIRLLMNDQLAHVAGGSYTLTYKGPTEGCAVSINACVASIKVCVLSNHGC